MSLKDKIELWIRWDLMLFVADTLANVNHTFDKIKRSVSKRNTAVYLEQWRAGKPYNEQKNEDRKSL